MPSSALKESSAISLLGLIVSSDLSTKSYIQDIWGKKAQRIDNNLYPAYRKFLHHTHALRRSRTSREAKNLILQLLANELLPYNVRWDMYSLSLLMLLFCQMLLCEYSKPQNYLLRNARSQTCWWRAIMLAILLRVDRSNSSVMKSATLLFSSLMKFTFFHEESE